MRTTTTALAAGVVLLLAFGACDAAAQAERRQAVPTPTERPTAPAGFTCETVAARHDASPTTESDDAEAATADEDPAPAAAETVTTGPQLHTDRLDEITAELDALLGRLNDSLNQSEGDVQP